MLWPRAEFHAAYGQIKHDGIKSGGCSVLILVALDVDALCACEILTSLLKGDFLSYSLLAVRGYEDIVRVRETRIRDAQGHERPSDVKSIVMINCGAIVNVMQLLALPEDIKCYIFDSHRPIHLANIYDANQQIVVFDDGAQSIEDYPADGSDIDEDNYEASDAEDDDEEDDEEEEEEEDNDVDEDEGEEEVDFGAKPLKSDDADDKAETDDAPALDAAQSGDKRKRESGQEDDGNDEDAEQDDVTMSSPKKLKEDKDEKGGENDEEDSLLKQDSTPFDSGDLDEQEEPESAKQAKRKRREEILRYYRGSYYGAPAATIAFELAQQMNNSRRELLWFAIVGLTKQFVLEEIDSDNYNLMIHRFQDEVLALDSSSSSSAMQDDENQVVNPAYDHGKITFEEEYRFMCYRHWSLYESMYYSDYVASKLGLYLDQARRVGAQTAAAQGETTLHVFLARMGFSLRQSQQKFTYMPLEMKQMLREKIQEMAPEFGLEDIFYGSFKRQFAFQYQLCAADAVYGLQALLEAPESYISSVFQAETHAQQNTWTSLFSIDVNGVKPISEKAQDADNDEEEDSTDDFRQQNFQLAHTALSCRSVASSKLMESGIKVSMELKQAIVRVGISIMERKLIVRVKHFRYVCLNIPEREQELFANANVLTQLALFLLHVHRASGKWGGPIAKSNKPTHEGANDEEEGELATGARNKPIVPLVLITRNPAQNCFLVVGLTCPQTPGELLRK